MDWQFKKYIAFIHFFIDSCAKTCWKRHSSRFNWGSRGYKEKGGCLCPRILLCSLGRKLHVIRTSYELWEAGVSSYVLIFYRVTTPPIRILGFKNADFLPKDKLFSFFKKKGESDGTEERPQLVKFGHQSGPDSSGFEPTAFDSQQCRAFIYSELLTLCICSIQDEQTSVEINPGLIKLSPLFQWTT